MCEKWICLIDLAWVRCKVRYNALQVVDGNGSLGDREFVSAKEIIRDAYKNKNTYLGNLASKGKVKRRQPNKRGRKAGRPIGRH